MDPSDPRRWPTNLSSIPWSRFGWQQDFDQGNSSSTATPFMPNSHQVERPNEDESLDSPYYSPPPTFMPPESPNTPRAPSPGSRPSLAFRSSRGWTKPLQPHEYGGVTLIPGQLGSLTAYGKLSTSNAASFHPPMAVPNAGRPPDATPSAVGSLMDRVFPQGTTVADAFHQQLGTHQTSTPHQGTILQQNFVPQGGTAYQSTTPYHNSALHQTSAGQQQLAPHLNGSQARFAPSYNVASQQQLATDPSASRGSFSPQQTAAVQQQSSPQLGAAPQSSSQQQSGGGRTTFPDLSAQHGLRGWNNSLFDDRWLLRSEEMWNIDHRRQSIITISPDVIPAQPSLLRDPNRAQVSPNRSILAKDRYAGTILYRRTQAQRARALEKEYYERIARYAAQTGMGPPVPKKFKPSTPVLKRIQTPLPELRELAKVFRDHVNAFFLLPCGLPYSEDATRKYLLGRIFGPEGTRDLSQSDASRVVVYGHNTVTRGELRSFLFAVIDNMAEDMTSSAGEIKRESTSLGISSNSNTPPQSSLLTDTNTIHHDLALRASEKLRNTLAAQQSHRMAANMPRQPSINRQMPPGAPVSMAHPGHGVIPYQQQSPAIYHPYYQVDSCSQYPPHQQRLPHWCTPQGHSNHYQQNLQPYYGAPYYPQLAPPYPFHGQHTLYSPYNQPLSAPARLGPLQGIRPAAPQRLAPRIMRAGRLENDEPAVGHLDKTFAMAHPGPYQAHIQSWTLPAQSESDQALNLPGFSGTLESPKKSYLSVTAPPFEPPSYLALSGGASLSTSSQSFEPSMYSSPSKEVQSSKQSSFSVTAEPFQSSKYLTSSHLAQPSGSPTLSVATQSFQPLSHSAPSSSVPLIQSSGYLAKTSSARLLQDTEDSVARLDALQQQLDNLVLDQSDQDHKPRARYDELLSDESRKDKLQQLMKDFALARSDRRDQDQVPRPEDQLQQVLREAASSTAGVTTLWTIPAPEVSAQTFTSSSGSSVPFSPAQLPQPSSRQLSSNPTQLPRPSTVSAGFGSAQPIQPLPYPSTGLLQTLLARTHTVPTAPSAFVPTTQHLAGGHRLATQAQYANTGLLQAMLPQRLLASASITPSASIPIIQEVERDYPLGSQAALIPVVPKLPYHPGSDSMSFKPLVGASIKYQNLTRNGKPSYLFATNPANCPFGETAKESKPAPWGVLKIGNIPYSLTRGEVANFLGRNAKIVSPDLGSPIHIIMDRSTGKTMDCYVEFFSAGDAQAAANKLLFRGNQLKLGNPPFDRVVNVEVSSQDILLKELFPRAKNVVWKDGKPTIEESTELFNSGFKTFVTSEELVMLVRHAEQPHRSSYTQKCPQRAYECMISTLYKFPWHSVENYTVHTRNQILLATRDLIKTLINCVRRGGALHVNPSLLNELLVAGLNAPGFSERQRWQLVQAAEFAGRDVKLSPLLKWWPWEVLGRKQDSDEDVVEYYAHLLNSHPTTVNTASESNPGINNPFGTLAVITPVDMKIITMEEMGRAEWEQFDTLIGDVLKMTEVEDE